MYFKKLIPAERIVAIIIPDKIRLFDEYWPSGEERERTEKRVRIAPPKANIGRL